LKQTISISGLLFLCMIFMQNNAVGQDFKKRDSLQDYIKTATIDSNKANALALLSNELIQYDTKTAEQYANQAISISRKIKYPKGEAEALLALSKIHRTQRNSLQALDKTTTALRIYEQLNDKTGLAKCYFELGYIYKETDNYQKAIANFTESLLLYKETGDESKVATCQMVMGHVNADRAWILKDTSYSQKTLALYTTALNYQRKINDQEKISVSLLNIANLYLGYNKISHLDAFLDKSLYYSNQSLKITQSRKDKLRTCINLGNIAEVYYLRKKYDTALHYYLIAYKDLGETGNIDFSLSTLYYIILTYKELKQYDKALETAKEYNKIATKHKYNGHIRNHYGLLSDIYLAQNDFKNAYKNRILYDKYSDSILDEEKAKALIKFQVEFETENKDREITLLNKTKELQSIKLKQQHTTRNYLVASIVLTSLLLLVIYNRFIVKTRANKIIEEKNKELEKLSIVARETANGVFITDADGNIEWFNEGFSKLFGWDSLDEYIQKRGKNIFEVSGNKDIANIIKEAISKKKSVTYENTTPTKKKGQLWIQTTLTPIFNPQDELIKLVFVETDITKLKNSEEQYLTVNKELEAFSYSISHDLRSPLRAINGYSKILQEDYSADMDEDGINAINAILNNSRRMGELIDDLLTFSRLGRTELTTSEIDMETLVKSIIEEETALNPSEIEFNINDLQTSKATPALIKQVWVNLISNAIKFSKNKSNAIIEIGSYVKDKFVVYYVKDNGAGFDMQYYNKLFGVFQRLHSQSEFEGTGIGLAIVQKIVHRHNGTVWAESKLNEGSIFYFSLPLNNS
jgi:PAS domain S-box-containing protein